MGIEEIVKAALKEDIGKGDITTNALFRGPLTITAQIIAGENGILCGLPVLNIIFKSLDKNIFIINKAKEGSAVKAGAIVCRITGDARKILTAERVSLNFLSRLSGIATLTRAYVEKAGPYGAKILDTRKTTPGLRELEKYAVKTGGGTNHRMGLYDQVLIKDNHIAAFKIKMRDEGRGTRDENSLARIIENAKKRIKKSVKIEIEVENLEEFKDALTAKPDIIMLDNMGISDIKKAVQIRNKLNTQYSIRNTKLEVSGGVTLDNISEMAGTGVDMISVGALTHSAKGLDFSLEVVCEK